MKKLLIVLLMLVVLVGSAFAKSDFMFGVTTGVDFYWSKSEITDLYETKISEIGLPLVASTTYFFNDNFGLFADAGMSFGLLTKKGDEKVGNSNFFASTLGLSYKAQIKNIDVISSLGAELYTGNQTKEDKTEVSHFDFQVVLKEQVVLNLTDNVKVLPGLKASFAFLEKISCWIPSTGKVIDMSPDKFFGFAIAPIVSVSVAL